MTSTSKVPNIFSGGELIEAAEVNANFQFCLDYVADIAPTAVATADYLSYGIVLNFDYSNYKVELDLSANLLYFNSIDFARASVATSISTTGPKTFAANLPRITDTGLYIDFGSTNYVQRYQDYPLFAPKQNSAGSTQFLINKQAELHAAGYDYFPSGNVFCIDNLADAGGSYTITLETAALVIGQTYEVSCICWVDSGHARLGITNSTFTELDTISTTPVILTDTFVCTSTSHQLYFKASASARVYGIGFYLGPPTTCKTVAYARYDNSLLGTDANNLLTGAPVDPTGITGLNNSAGTATLAVVIDSAATLLKSLITPGKTTDNVVRIDNSLGIVTGKIQLVQTSPTVGQPYSVTIWARIVSGTGGKIRNDNAGPFSDIVIGNSNLWTRYAVTYTPTGAGQGVFVQPDIGAVVDICACYSTQAASLPQAVLPYHLGTTTTDDDNLTWVPRLTPSPVVVEWGTSFQTELTFNSGDTVQLGIASEGPWIKQNVKYVRSLQPNEAIRTYTSPADATAMKKLWNYDYTQTPLDYSEFSVLDFSDDFTVFSVGEATDPPTPTRKWFAPGHTNFGYTKCQFTTPAQAAALGLDTWYCDGNSLRMRLNKVPSGTVYAACMSSVNTAGQGYRLPDEFYFETRVAFPMHSDFPWSAVWFKNPTVVESTFSPYVEFDLAEIYASDAQFWHSTWFIHVGAHPNPLGPQTDQFKSNLYPVNLCDGNYHTLGLKVTKQWIITYLDGYEARRLPYYAEWRIANSYILLNITGINDLDEYNNFVSPKDLYFDYVRVYRKP
jgi:hypothetical protein